MNNNRVMQMITTAILTLTIAPVFADSATIFNSDNGHYYKRFDLASVKWSVASANCQSLKAHLATFAGTDFGVNNKEADFVYAQLVSKSPAGGGSNDYNFNYIGAVYNENTFAWSWVTGEKFGKDFPSTSNGNNYYGVNTASGNWILTGGNGNYGNYFGATGYICEWDGNNFIASATVPDLTNDGVAENAALYLDYKTNKHTVVIRDLKKHKTLNTLTFATSATPPVGLAVIADMNNNGNAEIAVLSKLNVQIKDAKDNKTVLKSINFLDKNYQPRALSVMPDSNNNGFDDLTVLGVLQNGKTTTETRDSSTGAKLLSDTF